MSGSVVVLSKLEKQMFSSAGLVDKQQSLYAVQSILSVNPNRPEWCDVKWQAYGMCLEQWKAHPDRIGHGEDSPKFKTAETALHVWAAVQKEWRGRMRTRIIVRSTMTLELLMMGDGR